MPTKAEIAKFIQDNMTGDDDEHEASFEECLKKHPVHDAYTVDGKLVEAYVRVDAFAGILADWLNSK